ncbi:hypothetical protein R1flu_007803 [Riccia fluitans]|uniref:Uncharacterized protein n=1 Tax=Riccia fluitans TaxID=41844 RepID=A0ABD1Z2J1_9MARC
MNSLSEFYSKSRTRKCKSSPTTSYREKSSYFPTVPSTLAGQSSGPADVIVNSSGLQQAGLECRAEEGGAEKIQLEKASGEEYRKIEGGFECLAVI